MIRTGILVCLFLLPAGITLAQIGQSRADIIAKYGPNTGAGVSDDGEAYIVYETEFTSERYGAYKQAKAIYFTEMSDGRQLCTRWLLIDPAYMINTWVKLLNKAFVKVGSMEWKDLKNPICYTLEIKEGFCLLKAYFDQQAE